MIDNLQPRLGEIIDRVAHVTCRGVHITLIIAFTFIITGLTYVGLGIVFLFESLLMKTIYLTVGLWIVYNIIFNYVMATLVAPGNPSAVVPLEILRKID